MHNSICNAHTHSGTMSVCSHRYTDRRLLSLVSCEPSILDSNSSAAHASTLPYSQGTPPLPRAHLHAQLQLQTPVLARLHGEARVLVMDEWGEAAGEADLDAEGAGRQM